MKYTVDASLRELAARSRRLRRKREKKTLRALTAASLVLLVGLVSVVRTVAGQLGTGEETSAFGAFVLPDTAGGYVLAGVIAFALGAVFTLLCLRYRRRTMREMEENERLYNKEESDETDL